MIEIFNILPSGRPQQLPRARSADVAFEGKATVELIDLALGAMAGGHWTKIDPATHQAHSSALMHELGVELEVGAERWRGVRMTSLEIVFSPHIAPSLRATFVGREPGRRMNVNARIPHEIHITQAYPGMKTDSLRFVWGAGSHGQGPVHVRIRTDTQTDEMPPRDLGICADMIRAAAEVAGGGMPFCVVFKLGDVTWMIMAPRVQAPPPTARLNIMTNRMKFETEYEATVGGDNGSMIEIRRAGPMEL